MCSPKEASRHRGETLERSGRPLTPAPDRRQRGDGGANDRIGRPHSGRLRPRPAEPGRGSHHRGPQGGPARSPEPSLSHGWTGQPSLQVSGSSSLASNALGLGSDHVSPSLEAHERLALSAATKPLTTSWICLPRFELPAGPAGRARACRAARWVGTGFAGLAPSRAGVGPC